MSARTATGGVLRNYDLSKLVVALPNGPNATPFILDQSRLDTDPMFTYTNMLGDFTSLTINHACSIDGTTQFRPEASTLSLTTENMDVTQGLFGMNIVCDYDGVRVFDGFISSVAVNADVERESVTIQATSGTLAINNIVVENYSAPAESVTARFNRLGTGLARPLSLEPRADGKLSAMGAITDYSGTLFNLFQDLSDYGQARFFVTKAGTVVIDQTLPTVPVVTFKDEAATDALSYYSIGLAENLDFTVSKVFGVAAYDENVATSYQEPNSKVDRQERYVVNVQNAAGLSEWVAEYPTKASVQTAVTEVSTPWNDALLPLEVSDLVVAYYKEERYAGVVTGINYSINPKRWVVGLQLAPSHIVKFKADAPSLPRNFVSSAQTKNSISLSWTAPEVQTGFTGYQLRRITDNLPPEKNQGVVVATLGAGATSFVDSGVAAGRQYSYSLFATTAFTDVYSDPATKTLSSGEDMPPAVSGFTYEFFNAGAIAFNSNGAAGASANYNFQGYEFRFSYSSSGNPVMQYYYVTQHPDLGNHIAPPTTQTPVGYGISVRIVTKHYFGPWSEEVSYLHA